MSYLRNIPLNKPRFRFPASSDISGGKSVVWADVAVPTPKDGKESVDVDTKCKLRFLVLSLGFVEVRVKSREADTGRPPNIRR